MQSGDGSRRNYEELYSAMARRSRALPEKTAFVHRLIEIAAEISARSAIEFGCGMGTEAKALQELTELLVTATDGSAEMLERVPEDVRTALLDVCDPSAFLSNSYDLAYCSFLVHLLTREEKAAFYTSVWQALSLAGVFVVLTASENALRRRRITYYFPSALSIDMRRYLTIEQNASLLRAAGFANVDSEPVEMGHMSTDAELEMFVNRTCSIMRLIPTDEYERGLRRLKRDLARLESAEQRRNKQWSRTLIIARKT